MRSLPWITLTLATLVVVSIPLATLLDYDRVAILHGEVWRLLTGHFTHWSSAHLRWDLIAFLALGAVCERRGSRWLFGVTVATTAMVVSLVLLLAVPGVGTYRGLSAVDSALWLWAAAVVGDRRLTLALMSLFFAKLLAELASGAPLFVGPTAASWGVTVLPSVHLLGAAIGFGAAVAERKMRPPCASLSAALRQQRMTEGNTSCAWTEKQVHSPCPRRSGGEGEWNTGSA